MRRSTPQLRKDLGVWYTPDEVVRYMVARVDCVLREELGVTDGLADESVWVLDPCCGTGTYLVEVLRRIDFTLQAKGADALTRQDVKRAAMKRIVGFEILPAPFVIAHLQLGLLLAELGVPLSHMHGEHERAAVYLTNALTGWKNHEAPTADGVGGRRVHPAQLLFEFEEERDAAAKVKREAPILVVLGNPPYNGYAGVAADEEADLVEPYKRGLRSEWGITKNYLDDLYVRFFRLAERSITASPRGRRDLPHLQLLLAGQSLCRGDAQEHPRRLPDRQHRQPKRRQSRDGQAHAGGPTRPEHLLRGPRIGTASKSAPRSPCSFVPRLHTSRRLRFSTETSGDRTSGHSLLPAASAEGNGPHYAGLHPASQNRFALRPMSAAEGYSTWPAITELGARWSLGSK